MEKISVIIHTYNSENDIERCIESAKLLTDDIIVVDMESTDNTVKAAKQLKTHVVSFPASNYVEPARDFGIKSAKTDWVFILDADERITTELADEIKKSVASKKYSHYKVLRRNIFGGKYWLRHGGWWPDYQIRLIHRPDFIQWPKQIHSTPQVSGKQGILDNHIFHYFHGDINKMVEKTVIFEDIESDLLFKAGRQVNTATFFRKFFGELYRRMIKGAGFMDGTVGIIESIYQAYSKTITWLYLYEKQKSRSV